MFYINSEIKHTKNNYFLYFQYINKSMIFIENCNKILTTQYGDITGLNPENTMHSVSLPARHNQIFSNFALILGIVAKPDKNVKLI